MSLKVTLDTVTPALARVTEKLQDIVEQEMNISGQSMEATAQRIVPVRTGYLQSTIGYEVQVPMSLILFATASYAEFVEFGTRFMAAQPYLRPAYDGELPGLQDGILAAILHVWQTS